MLIATIRLPFAVVDSGGWLSIAPSVPEKYAMEGHTFSVVPPGHGPPPCQPFSPGMSIALGAVRLWGEGGKIIMIGATGFTPAGGDGAPAPVPLLAGIRAAFVAYGRWRLAPRPGNRVGSERSKG